MQKPEWADQLIGEVLFYKGRKHPPQIRWVKRHRLCSSGVTYVRSKKITICVGSDMADAKMVVIHELGHWLLRQGHHHDIKFWLTVWELYYLFKDQLNWELVKRREFQYKGKAKVAFERLGY